MNNNHVEVWQNCLLTIRQHVNDQAFKTWFEPIVPIALSEDALTIQVPNKFFYEWLEEHYIDILKVCIHNELGKDGKLRYSLPRAQSNTPPKNTAPVNPTLSKDLERHYGQVPLRTSEQKISPFVMPGIQKVKIDSQLNPNYTF